MSADTAVKPRAAEPRAPRTLSDRLLGILGGAFVLLALVVLIRGGEEDTSRRAAVPPPRIDVISPEGGARVTGPLEIVFRVDADLRHAPSGWGTGDLHLHLLIDGREFMPAASDIERLPSGAYRWSLRALEPGTRELRLSWSDQSHQALAGGGSPAFVVYAR